MASAQPRERTRPRSRSWPTPLARAAESSAQIVASARQQATGMVQISQAARTIDEVARLNLVATREAEQAARNLAALGAELTQLGAR